MDAAMAVTTTLGNSYRDILNGKVTAPTNSAQQRYRSCEPRSSRDALGHEVKASCTRGNDTSKVTKEPLILNPSTNLKCLICQQDIQTVVTTDDEKKNAQDIISAQSIIWTKLIESLSMRDQASFRLIPFTDVSSIWNVIQLRLRNNTTSNATNLFEEFSNLQLGPNEDAISFINRICEKRDQLKSIGEVTSDTHCKAQLLKGLRENPDFKTYIDIWKSSDSTSKSFADAIGYFVQSQQHISSDPKSSINLLKGKKANQSKKESQNRNAGHEKPPCKFFQQGHCKKGDSCNFSHRKPSSSSSSKKNSVSFDGDKSKEICQLFLKGQCKYGNKCHRVHPSRESKESSSEEESKTQFNFLVSHQSERSAACFNPYAELFGEEEGLENPPSSEPNAVHSLNTSNDSFYAIDSGSTVSTVNGKTALENETFIQSSAECANGSSILFTSKGNVRLNDIVTLTDVRKSDQVQQNLLSVSAALDKNPEAAVIFLAKEAIFLSNGLSLWTQIAPQADRILTATRSNGLYLTRSCVSPASDPKEDQVHLSKGMEQATWHRRLGHFNQTSSGVKSQLDDCSICTQAKLHRGKFHKDSHREKGISPGDILSFDLAGPINLKSDLPLLKELFQLFGKPRFLGILVDSYSGLYMVAPLVRKTDASSWIKTTINRMGKVRMFYTDGESVTNSNDFHAFCSAKGINHQMTTKATPQHNGASERGFRTIFNSIRSLLLQANLPRIFWMFAAQIAALSTNLLRASCKDEISRYEAFHNRPPSLSALKVFGCDADVHVLKEDREVAKLSPRSVPCIYLGPDTQRENGSIFLNVQSWSLIHARTADAFFHENKFSYGRMELNLGQYIQTDQIFQDPQFGEPELSNPPPPPELPMPEVVFSEAKQPVQQAHLPPPPLPPADLKQQEMKERVVIEVSDDDDQSIPPVNPIVEDRRSSLRPRPQPRDMGPYVHFVEDTHQTPLSYGAAMKLPAALEWKAASEKELLTLQANDTWELVDRPKHRKVIGSRWVYKLKIDPSTRQTVYKARFVAKGYSQLPGIDFNPNEISSTVMKMKSLRIILSLTVQAGKTLRSMDAISAFTQSKLKEEIYIEQPEGFAVDPEHKVLRLRKALYGLKQASENWHQDVVSFMRSQGFQQTKMDDNVFFKRSKTNKLMFVCLYVDDTTNSYSLEDEEEFEQFADALKSRFKITDLGQTRSILGIRIDYDRSKGTLSLSQPKYIQDILETYGMADCNPIHTPDQKEVDHRGPLSALHCPASSEEVQFMKDKPYRALIGSLLYLTTCTRPDLTHSVATLSRFSSNPGPRHWFGALRILRYLKKTQSLPLIFRKSPNSSESLQITGSSDANWGNDLKGRKSIHGYIISLHGCPISWTSKKQTFVALSSTESEYVGLSEAVREIKWLSTFIKEFDIPVGTPILYGDNSASIFIANSTSMDNRVKGIDIKYHFIKDEIAHKNVILKRVPTQQNVADIFTKPLDVKRFKFLASQLLHIK